MGRTKGSRNKNTALQPDYCFMSIEDRITVLAQMIIEQIEADQHAGGVLLHEIEGNHAD